MKDYTLGLTEEHARTSYYHTFADNLILYVVSGAMTFATAIGIAYIIIDRAAQAETGEVTYVIAGDYYFTIFWTILSIFLAPVILVTIYKILQKLAS